MRQKILVIEDDEAIRSNLLELLDAEGLEAIGMANGRLGVMAARDGLPDLIVCDIMMPELDGYGVLTALREDPVTAGIPFIFLSARADRSDIRAGMSLGADDYLTKPFAQGDLLDAIGTRLRRRAELHTAGMTRPPPAPVAGGTAADERGQSDVVLADPAMRRLYAELEHFALGTINVLLLGETGVGKEVVAERVHTLSPRRGKPFVRLNCSAFTETLLESELFGHERGAFSGATLAKPGLLESADGGTVFLDEVGELPREMQSKLLRVLEERMVRRVGALRPRPIDVRFVSATNRDLAAEIATGVFRRDLYWRLNGATLSIPPLRERPSEVEPLARRFLDRAWQHTGRTVRPVFTIEAMDALRAHTWPGNIRELRNVVERAVLLATSGRIAAEHLPLEGERISSLPGERTSRPTEPPARHTDPAASTSSLSSPPQALRGAVEDAERTRIVATLAECNGNQTRAAELLGVARRTLINKIEQYGLERPRKR